MENIYVTVITGAGFSRPFGLPVMGDFIDRARDLYFLDPIKHKSFEKILKTIQDLYKTKEYINLDLKNIEDLF